MNLFAPEKLARFNRRQAALIHLGISAAVALAIVATMLLVWYPSPWFAAAGGGTLLLLLVGVDVIIGPLLTFVVFDPAKKSLVYDLAVIVMLQIAALVYGVHVMACRASGFRGLPARDIRCGVCERRGDRGHGRGQASGISIVAADRAEDGRGPHSGGPGRAVEDRHGIGRRRSRFHGVSRASTFRTPRPPGRRPHADNRWLELAQRSPEHAEAVAGLVRSSGRSADALVYLPLRTRLGERTIVLGKAEGEVIGVLPVSPH